MKSFYITLLLLVSTFLFFLSPTSVFAVDYYYDPYATMPQYGYGQGIYLGQPTYETGPYSSYTPYTTYNTTPSYAYPTYCSYYNCAQQSIYLSSLTPMSGPTGTDVTIYGSGFTENNNTVHFGVGIVPFLRSYNNSSISFRVPTNLAGYGSESVQLRSYEVYVTNARGENSNRLTYTVTGGAGYGNQPFVSGLTGPGVLATNNSGAWSLSVYGKALSLITVEAIWGDEYAAGSPISKQSVLLDESGMKSISFAHAYTKSGTYTPTFIASNSYGSNSSSATVVVGGGSSASGSVYLNSLSPLAVQAGVQVILFGSGFTPYDNVIHFGSGGLRSVVSVGNGSALYFAVPHYISPCDTVVGSCTVTPSAVTPGSYPIFVTNGNGTTQTLNVTVTN